MTKVFSYISNSEYTKLQEIREKLGLKSTYELLQIIVKGFLEAHEVSTQRDLSSEIDDVFNDLITHDHNGLEPKGEQFLRRI